jgi:autotransporter-associated beta strand protein
MKKLLFSFFLMVLLMWSGTISEMQAQALYWNGSTDALWSTIANWSTVIEGGSNPAAIPGASDMAIFHATSVSAAQNPETRGDQSVKGLEFTTDYATSIRSNTSADQNSILTIGSSGITKTGAGAVTFAHSAASSVRRLDIALSDNQTWQNNNATGNLTIGFSSTTATNCGYLKSSGADRTLTLTGTSVNNRINSIIQDGTAGEKITIVKEGAGTWTIAPANSSTFFGGTIIREGLFIAIAPGTGTVPENILGKDDITLEGGTFSFRANGNGSATAQTIAPNNNINVAGNVTFDVNRASGSSQNKTIVFDKIRSIGGYTLTVTGANNYDLKFNGFTNLTGSATFNPTTTRLTLAGAVGETGGSYGITKSGSSTLTLSAANSYTGATTVNEGTLILGASASINNSSQLSIAAGATFDVSALADYTLSSNTTLISAGAATAATIKGGTTVSLGSQAIALTYTPETFTGDLTRPALTISQGALTLNNNTISVNNASGTALGVGTYRLISVTGETITGTPNSVVTVSGSGIENGKVASISVSGGFVNLVVSEDLGTYNTSIQPKTVNAYVNSGNQLVIDAPEKSNYAVYSALGQLIQSGIINADNKISSFKLSAGVYLVKVNNISKRVIVNQ